MTSRVAPVSAVNDSRASSLSANEPWVSSRTRSPVIAGDGDWAATGVTSVSAATVAIAPTDVMCRRVMSCLLGGASGMDDEEPTAHRGDRCVGSEELVGQAACGTGRQRLGPQRVSQVMGGHALDGSRDGQERDEVAGSALQVDQAGAVDGEIGRAHV